MEYWKKIEVWKNFFVSTKKKSKKFKVKLKFISKCISIWNLKSEYFPYGNYLVFVHSHVKPCLIEETWHEMNDTDIFILLYRYLTESYGSGQDIDDRIVEGIEVSFI